MKDSAFLQECIEMGGQGAEGDAVFLRFRTGHGGRVKSRGSVLKQIAFRAGRVVALNLLSVWNRTGVST
ncbi:hypothetical protein CEW83_00985 [Parazoarcus communis]|uniref:Uncharacterized protein n=1 Tax=Parazoarcus communis TaxID=41977 RepID=A0A2U8GKC1_9RHOO|nr:hypothetical protein CEW83_00985 [Parazoarcus communis]